MAENRDLNSREVVIPKWALSAFLAAWSTFVLIFLPWSVWVTNSLYLQSSKMDNLTIRLEFIDKSTQTIVEMNDTITDLNHTVGNLQDKIEALELKLDKARQS